MLGVGLTGLPQGVPTGWVLQAGATRMARSAGQILASGSWGLDKDDLTIYHNLSLAVQGSEYTAVVDGKVRWSWVFVIIFCNFDAMTIIVVHNVLTITLEVIIIFIVIINNIITVIMSILINF